MHEPLDRRVNLLRPLPPTLLLPPTAAAVSSRYLVEKLNKKNKNNNVKPFMVKNHLWVFINTNIENPAFDSQVRHAADICIRGRGNRCKCGLPPTSLLHFFDAHASQNS